MKDAQYLQQIQTLTIAEALKIYFEYRHKKCQREREEIKTWITYEGFWRRIHTAESDIHKYKKIEQEEQAILREKYGEKNLQKILSLKFALTPEQTKVLKGEK